MNKVCLITGATNGIGKELAILFKDKGYSLVLIGRDASSLTGWNSGNIDVIEGDLTEKTTRGKAVAVIKNKYKRLDILINNAGITFIQPIEQNTEKDLDKIMAINLKVPILITQELYPLMKEQKSGTIVFINSAAGKEGKLHHTMYCATKFGLKGFAESLRLEAKKNNIRILNIHPGGVDTKLYRNQPEINSSVYMDSKKLAEIIVYLSETEGLSPDEISINRLSK